MASHRAVHGLMLAVEELLKRGFPEELGKVQLLSSADFKSQNFGSMLGVYLHRMRVEPALANPYASEPRGSGRQPVPQLALNLHFLLISWATSAAAEIEQHAWACQRLSAQPELDVSHLASADPEWRPDERARIAPEDMATEDLYRIWDALPAKYTLSSAWVLRTVRVSLPRELGGEPVTTSVFDYLPPGSDREIRP